MYPTRLDVKTAFLGLLDDPTEAIYVDYPASAPTVSVFQPAFDEAYSELYTAFLNFQCPRIELVTSTTVTPLLTELTPADAGIFNFGDIIWLRERPLGSNIKFRDMYPMDDLPQRPPHLLLRDFVWRNNTFYFVGATQPIELQIKYDTSSQAPTDDNTVIMVDDCKNFLANYAAAKAGPRKGDTDIAKMCYEFAVGPRYNQGTLGGALSRLINPLVRSRQNVQIAHRPYTTQRRRGYRWAAPYIQAPLGGGDQNVPFEFTTADGSIVGPVDGINTVFWLPTGNVNSMQVTLNGLTQTYGVDFTWINNQINFITVPQPGDIISAWATTSGTAVAYAPPDRTMSNSMSFGAVNITEGCSVTVGVIPVPGSVNGQGVTWAVNPPLPQGVDAIVQIDSPGFVTFQLLSMSGVRPFITIPASTYFVTVTA